MRTWSSRSYEISVWFSASHFYSKDTWFQYQSTSRLPATGRALARRSGITKSFSKKLFLGHGWSVNYPFWHNRLLSEVGIRIWNRLVAKSGRAEILELQFWTDSFEVLAQTLSEIIWHAYQRRNGCFIVITSLIWRVACGFIHAQAPGWQLVVRSFKTPGLTAHLVERISLLYPCT